MMTKQRPKAGLSRADLLWSFAVVDKAQQAEMAELLGFEKKPEKEAENQSAGQGVMPFSGLTPTFSGSSPKLPNLTTQQTPAYYRITARKRDPEAAQDNDVDPYPEWYQNAQADYFSKTQISISVIHRTVPRYQPLMSWSRLWPFLYRVLGTTHTGIKPDLAKLVKHVAAGKVIRHIPRRQHLAWAESAQILIDINDNNFPYREDFFYLCTQLKKLRGEQGLDIQYLDDQPGGAVIRYQNQQEVISSWQPPNAETPLLILSDLGMYTKSRRVLYAWLVFGQQLKIHGCRPVVLMPVAARDIDQRLWQYFDCVVWDSTSRLKPVYAPTTTEASQQKRVHDLLAYFFPTVRVDAGLVRAVRQLLPANHYDIGHETAVWQQPVVKQVNDQWGWQAGSRADYLPKFIKLINALPPGKQKALVTLIGQYHAQLPEELYFEAMAAFLQTPQLTALLPEEVRLATQQFMANLVKSYVEYAEHSGLDLYAQRYLMRLDAGALWQATPYTEALYILAKVRHQQGDKILWPEGISVQQLGAFINKKQAPRAYLLRQTGQQLQLVAEEIAQQQSGDWGMAGITLARLILNDTQSVQLQKSQSGADQAVSFELQTDSAIDLGLFTEGMHPLQLGAETLTVEATLHTEKLPWAFSRGMGAGGLSYVETRDQQGNVYRWYWHAPEWHQEAGMLRGVWYAEKPGVLTPPSWAETSGRDQYGIYADFAVQDVVQRMRWIEPGRFNMGSPENEILHQVTLSQGYWLADTACTQALWALIMNNNPSRFKAESRPVDNVSWEDIQQFLQQINNQSNLALILPTEAQWEYACRAGTITAFYFGDNISPEQVNYDGTSPYNKGKQGLDREETVAVKSLPANDWGLYEIHGNIWEWCQDRYGDYSGDHQLDPTGVGFGDDRVLRGGSWFSGGRDVRSAVRGSYSPAVRYGHTGFRLARGHQVQPVRQINSKQEGSPDNSRVPEQRQSGRSS